MRAHLRPHCLSLSVVQVSSESGRGSSSFMGLSFKSIVRNLKPPRTTPDVLHLHPLTSAVQCKDGPGVLVNDNDRNSGVWLVSGNLSAP